MTKEEQIIRTAMKRAGVNNRSDLATLCGFSDDTLRRRFRNPENITLFELRRIAEKCSMATEEVLGVFNGDKHT